MKAPALLLTAFIALAAALPGQARPKNVTDPDIPRSLPTDGGAVSVQWTERIGPPALCQSCSVPLLVASMLMGASSSSGSLSQAIAVLTCGQVGSLF